MRKLTDAFIDKLKEDDLIRNQPHYCANCGSCTNLNPIEHRCQLDSRYESVRANPNGLNWMMIDILDKKMPFSPGVVDFVYRCTTCGQCHENCCCELDTRELIHRIRKQLVEEGVVPDVIMDVLKSASKKGNVWGESKNNRKKWAEGLDIKKADEAGDFEYLLFVGDSYSFVDRNKETSRKFVEILNTADVSFAYLGNLERSSGNEIKALGEQGLFEALAEENISNFKKFGVKKIIAMSPHAFHIIKNEYGQLDPDLDIEVLHYTQVLSALIKDGKLKLNKSIDKKVTYQDSCYLGKHNGIYDDPREVIGAVPGVEFTEFNFVRHKGVCCGGGGGGVWVERSDGVKPEAFRFEEALEMKVDYIITACPLCTQQLDAIKADYSDNKIEVKELIDFVHDAI